MKHGYNNLFSSFAQLQNSSSNKRHVKPYYSRIINPKQVHSIMDEKITLIAVDASRLEQSEKEVAELKELVLLMHQKIDALKDYVENSRKQEYEPEYVMIASALKYTDFGEKKIRRLANTYFKNGEAVIRTRNKGSRGVTYCVADLKQADLRSQQQKEENQKSCKRLRKAV